MIAGVTVIRLRTDDGSGRTATTNPGRDGRPRGPDAWSTTTRGTRPALR